MIVTSFLAFLLCFVAIGLWSMRRSRHNSIDYLLAGRSVAPWLTALSAVATNNSGYMFIGLIGYTYLTGLAAIWMMLGWIIGDFIASSFIHRQVRLATERHDVHTFSGLLSRWQGGNYRVLRFLSGVMILLFLGTYAAAQLSAGSKALQVLFDWQHWTGAVMGAVMVLLYSFAGGIRASIWTDAAQSIVMIGAMFLLMAAALDSLGGWSAFVAGLHAVEPGYMQLFPVVEGYGPWLGPLLFVAGWLFTGFGVAGQPHIMIRFMALDDAENLRAARAWYYGWFTLFWSAAIIVGMGARLLLPEVASFDAELALPTLALQLLPEVLVGVILAGIFAATMSTADSLILSCAAALTRDFHWQKQDHYWLTKLGTVAVTLGALAIALSGHKSVYDLVLDAWGVLASAFAPLLAVYALGQRVSERLAVAMLISGVLTMYGWSLCGPAAVYAVAPGISAGLLVFVAAKSFSRGFR
ncbi:MAG: sodium/proline symporter [Pseudomonadota bacterium]